MAMITAVDERIAITEVIVFDRPGY